MSAINIAIGEGVEPVTYEIWETEASSDYDGFGTFTIMELDGIRTVLIRSEHWDWQTSRYASGFCLSRQSHLDVDAVVQFLWKRIMGRPQ